MHPNVGKRELLLNLTQFSPHNDWQHSTVKRSSKIVLQEGEYVFLEANAVELAEGDHLGVGVQIHKTNIMPTSSNISLVNQQQLTLFDNQQVTESFLLTVGNSSGSGTFKLKVRLWNW